MAPLRMLLTFVPRPLLPAVNVEGHWHLLKLSEGETVRKISLITRNPSSFFSQIEVSGEYSGKVSLLCRFPNQYLYGRIQLWHKLPKMGVEWESTNEAELILGFHHSQSLIEAERIFKAFTQENTCSRQHTDLILELLNRGDWRKVTPLKLSERLPQRSLPMK